MQITDEGLALIKRFEGFRPRAYRCPAGVWTIGYGHTSSAGPPAVSADMAVDETMAETILRRDVEQFAAAVRTSLTRRLDDRQFSALVSFAYNVGIGNFRSSSVLRAVNAGDFDAVPRRLQLWNKAGGKVLAGLVRRRGAEAELFAAREPATGPVTRPQGKALHRSTTVLAALLSILTATLSALLSAPSIGWAVAFLLLAATAAAGIWIIRERWRKALEEGL